MFLSFMQQTSCRQNPIQRQVHTLVDIIIMDLTHTNLLSQMISILGFATCKVAQMKENNYKTDTHKNNSGP
jgi:hypothetical protein